MGPVAPLPVAGLLHSGQCKYNTYNEAGTRNGVTIMTTFEIGYSRSFLYCVCIVRTYKLHGRLINYKSSIRSSGFVVLVQSTVRVRGFW